MEPESSAAASRARRPPAPPSILPTAFVSHRRDESGWLAEYLSEDLPGLLRGSRIVVDVDLIRPGDDWRAVLDRELDRSAALLALIGPAWEHCAHPTVGYGSTRRTTWSGTRSPRRSRSDCW